MDSSKPRPLERVTSANNTIQKFEGKRPEDGAGHGQAAWKALTEKYNGHTKEAGRACHEKLANTKTEPRQDPDDFFFVLDICRDLLHRKWGTRCMARGTRILFYVLSPLNARGYKPPATGGETLGWTASGTWYTPCKSATFCVLPTQSRSPVAALPCRWRDTTVVTCRAPTAKDSNTPYKTAPS